MPARYVEIVIEGRKGWASGFVHGFLCGRGATSRPLDAEQEGFDCEPLRERIRELLQPSAETAHLLVQEDILAIVREAVDQGRMEGRAMVIRHERRIAGARFDFSFAIYAREPAERIRGYLDHLPAGVSLSEDSRFEEVVDPEGKGTELYAPYHDYELRGRGTVEGALEGVLATFRLCRKEELIHLKALGLLPVTQEGGSGR